MKRAARPAQRIYTLADLAAIAPQLARHLRVQPAPPDGRRTAPCWLWTGAMSWRAGKPCRPKTGLWIGDTRYTLPYRAAWVLLTGQHLLPGMHICHYVCNNPRCCNPAHLVAGSNADNRAHRRARQEAS